MRKIYKKLFVLTALGCACNVNAQISKPMVIEKALNTIDNYVTDVNVGDEEQRDFFLDLFVNVNSKVYNDIIGMESTQDLTAEQYADYLGTKTKNLRQMFSNLKVEDCKYDNGWTVKLSMDKSISYYNGCGVYLSSSEWYNENYHLLFSLVYDQEDDMCKIASIEGNISGNIPPLSDYVVFKKNDDRDLLLLYKKKKMEFNSHDQAFLKKPVLKSDFTYKDVDTNSKIEVDECGSVTASYKQRCWRVKPYVDINLGKPFNVQIDDIEVAKQKSMGYGVEVGYSFPSKGALKTSLNLGVGMATSSFELSTADRSFTFSTTQDVDGDRYERHYERVSVTQQAKFMDLTVPVYADLSYSFSRYFSLFVDAGVVARLNLSSSVSDVQGSAYVYGVYPNYGNLVMNENWGYNGFGNVSISESNIDNSKLKDVNKFVPDVLVGGGLRISAGKIPLSLELGVRYQYGILDVIKSNGNPVSLSGTIEEQNALLYNTVNNLTSTEHVRNLTEGCKSVKRNPLNLHISVIYQF